MNNEPKNKLIPKLRFPEFNDSGEWEVKRLGEVTTVFSERNKDGKKLPIYSISNVSGFIPQSEQFEGINSHDRGYDISLYKIIKRNTFAYNPARINVGSIGYSGELDNIIISSLYVCFITNEKLDDSFLFHFLKTSVFNEAVKRNVEGGIRSYLFYENFAKINVPIPSLPEQQKIADCLSSLDELITAEGEKLQSLKEHKKGLMQQLFPAEGETTPRLRFPEFKDSGEWEEETLGELGVFTGGGTPSKASESYWKGNIPWISSSDISEDSIHQIEITRFISEQALHDSATKIVPENSILLVSRVGVGKLAVSTQSLCTSQDFTNFTPYKDNLIFLAYLLKSNAKKLLEFSQGMAIKGFTKEDISKLHLFLPSLSEQQKIADCLSSLDEVISGQAEKIDLLKQHKKGLMQQLFPKMEEE